MTGYLVAVGVIFGVNLLPAFGPPTWAVLVFFRLNSDLAAVPLVLLGAAAAASGRLLLATGSRRLRSRFSAKRLQNLNAAEYALTNSRGKAFAGLGLFALSPVPSAQLFVAAGLLSVPLIPLTLAFFAGRLVSYSIYVGAASAAKDSFGGILTEAFASPVGVALQVLMLAGIVLLVRVDWAKWLDRRGHPAPSSRGTTHAAQRQPEARNRGAAGCPVPPLRRPSTADMTEGVGVDPKDNNESLMEATGMGLLPGLTGAMALIVVAMAALLTGSMWAVIGLLALIGLATAAIVVVVLAVTAEGEEGRRLRAKVPGLGDHTWMRTSRGS